MTWLFLWMVRPRDWMNEARSPMNMPRGMEIWVLSNDGENVVNDIQDKKIGERMLQRRRIEAPAILTACVPE